MSKPFYQINTEAEYEKAYKTSIENPENFWETIAETFVWKKKWNQVLAWNFEEPSVKWFLNGKLNITENCIDRHLQKKAESYCHHLGTQRSNSTKQKIYLF